MTTVEFNEEAIVRLLVERDRYRLAYYSAKRRAGFLADEARYLENSVRMLHEDVQATRSGQYPWLGGDAA